MVGGAARHLLIFVFLCMTACKGAPARLVAGNEDTVVLNTQRAVQLPVRVLDARGRGLDSTGVRYEWTSGAPITVSNSGMTTCTQTGDAKVRASLGQLVTDIVVYCRPVRDVRGLLMINLVLGAPPQAL